MLLKLKENGDSLSLLYPLYLQHELCILSGRPIFFPLQIFLSVNLWSTEFNTLKKYVHVISILKAPTYFVLLAWTK